MTSLASLAHKSIELQRALAGTVRVTARHIRDLHRLADLHGVRHWQDTRDEQDYDRLIALALSLNTEPR